MEYKPLNIGGRIARKPIVQGGMGVGISLSGLAGAVAKAGGVGLISTAQIGFKEPDFVSHTLEANLRAMEKEFLKARATAPQGIIGFNIMVATRHYKAWVAKAVELGADLIVSGAGLPALLPGLVEGSGVKIAPIVSTEKSARVILKHWDRKFQRTADMVVVEGPKAGGHLGFSLEQLDTFHSKAYDEEILKIMDVARDYEKKYTCSIPVVVAGGISGHAEAAHYFQLGADGVQVASRFVTTVECDAHENYKQAYIRAKKEDIAIVKSPVGMPGRAILNPRMKKVMSGECFRPEKCLGCLEKCVPDQIPYCITDSLVNAAIGNVEEGLVFCGADAYKAEKIETVKSVIDSILDYSC